MIRENYHNMCPIVGRNIVLREVSLEDAEFIHRIRTTGRGAKFLHPSPGGVENQRQYLAHYLTLFSEWYFLVQDKNGQPLGTVSAYNIKGDSIEIGRWVMDEVATAQQSFESDCMIKKFVFETLGWDKIHCSTKLINHGIRRFNASWGMTITGDDGELIYFSLDKETWLKKRSMFERLI